MMTRMQCWLLTHPRLARPLRVLALVQLLSVLAVTTAPHAAASTNAVILNWTGLHDNYGVPVGDLYLSLPSLADRLTQTGPHATVVDPTTWPAWLMHGIAVLFDSLTAANILTAEIGFFVGIFALALWLFRVTIASYWITVLGEIARAVSTAVISVTTRWGLVAITVPIGVFMGVLAFRRGEHGRGATLILLALFMPALAVAVFADPAGMMYGPDGLLQFSRRIAFSTAQAATHGGAISGGGFTAQVDALTSSLITHVVREPLQVFNFGHVVDRVGGCGPMVSEAWKQGAKDGPIQALIQCGNTSAVTYAQNLDGSNVVGGGILLMTALLFGGFMISAGASVLMVSVKAIYTSAKLLPAILAGGIDGAARQHAKSTVWQYFRHPLEAMVYILYVSVMGLAIERLVSRPLPAELGGASPFAHVLITAGASMVALYLLRHIRADLAGTHPGRGVMGRATDVALGMGMHAALRGTGRAALGGARGARGLFNRRQTPWEKMDEQAASASPQELLGPAQEGFDPVPGEDGSTAAAADASNASASAAPPSPGPSSGDGGLPPVLGGPPAPAPELVAALNPLAPPGRQPAGKAPARPQPRGSAATPGLEAGNVAAPAAAPDVAPITAVGGPVASAWEQIVGGDQPGAAPLNSYVDHNADVPLPLDIPPPEDLDRAAPPPEEDLGPPPATVDPITGH